MLEIGGNIPYIKSNESVNCNDYTNNVFHFEFLHTVYTFSGRNAISIMLDSIDKSFDLVLLPSYTCKSCITPFSEKGIEAKFYNINHDLTVNLESLKRLISINKERNIILYVQTYFGFNTVAATKDMLQSFSSNKCILVEDITHSWLNQDHLEADFYICSFRKWLGISDGAAVGSNKFSLNTCNLNEKSRYDVFNKYSKASENKIRYLRGDLINKDDFNPLFKEISKDFCCSEIYSINSQSKKSILLTDFNQVISSRRRNAKYLLENINNKLIKPISKSLNNGVVPLYVPVYVSDDSRDKLQQYLFGKKIYCPIHWPVPSSITEAEKQILYNHELSVVCDQRYTLGDMKRIADAINNFEVRI